MFAGYDRFLDNGNIMFGFSRVPNEEPRDPHPLRFLLILLPHSLGNKYLIPYIPHSSRNSKSDSSYFS